MRKSIKEFARICAEILPLTEPIYEFGSFQVPGQENFADLRPLFPGKRYVGADMREGPGVDIILNLHDINLPSESVGTVLMLDTLEHVEFPHKAIAEAYRILKPNGILVISSVMNFYIHDHPHDYWRFTPEAFKSLLRCFAESYVDFAGQSNFPHTVVAVGLKAPLSKDAMEKLATDLKHWGMRWKNTEVSGWRQLIKLFIPPILLSAYRNIRS